MKFFMAVTERAFPAKSVKNAVKILEIYVSYYWRIKSVKRFLIKRLLKFPENKIKPELVLS